MFYFLEEGEQNQDEEEQNNSKTKTQNEENPTEIVHTSEPLESAKKSEICVYQDEHADDMSNDPIKDRKLKEKDAEIEDQYVIIGIEEVQNQQSKQILRQTGENKSAENCSWLSKHSACTDLSKIQSFRSGEAQKVSWMNNQSAEVFTTNETNHLCKFVSLDDSKITQKSDILKIGKTKASANLIFLDASKTATDQMAMILTNNEADESAKFSSLDDAKTEMDQSAQLLTLTEAKEPVKLSSLDIEEMAETLKINESNELANHVHLEDACVVSETKAYKLKRMREMEMIGESVSTYQKKSPSMQELETDKENAAKKSQTEAFKLSETKMDTKISFMDLAEASKLLQKVNTSRKMEAATTASGNKKTLHVSSSRKVPRCRRQINLVLYFSGTLKHLNFFLSRSKICICIFFCIYHSHNPNNAPESAVLSLRECSNRTADSGTKLRLAQYVKEMDVLVSSMLADPFWNQEAKHQLGNPTFTFKLYL